MKPRLVKLVVFLLLGAIVNVAVAWGFAATWQFESNVGLTDQSFRDEHLIVLQGDTIGFTSGLPARALQTILPAESSTTKRTCWTVSVRGYGRVWLPTGVLWPGFAINTVFYAGLLWLLFAAPLALRRRRRIKRGLCPKCAYPVGTNERCTECGGVVQAQGTTT